MPHRPIPLVSTLSEIYTEDALMREGVRWNSLFEQFQQEFETPVQKVSRAPGRVNIIGEHIDYCGFSVLPAAVDKDVLIAFSTTSPSSSSSLPSPSSPGKTVFVLRNVESKYTPTSFEVDLSGNGQDLKINTEEHHWSNYFIAGLKGILTHLAHNPQKSGEGEGEKKKGLPERVCVMVNGTVPEGSGLSSSSAMTTASAMCVLDIVGRRDGEEFVNRRDVTNVAIEGERLVGVNSGGMDQSASVFSLSQHLLHIEFMPQLEARAIPLPVTEPGFSFVIANTLVKSNKKLTAKYQYNLRVVECRLGALLLAKHLNLPYRVNSRPFPTYKTILDSYYKTPPPAPGPVAKGTRPPTHLPPTLPTRPALPSSRLPPNQATKSHELRIFMGLVLQALGGPGMEQGMTWSEVAEKLEVDPTQLQLQVEDREVEPENGRFKIWTRARHVFSEALRVYEFKKLLEDTAATASRVATPSGDGAESPVLHTTGGPPSSHALDNLSNKADQADATSDLRTIPSDVFTTSGVAIPRGDHGKQSKEIVEKMGGLMDESMRSCQLDYECSCQELNELTRLAKKNGAFGSRVTGAGWGGATVSLVLEPDVPKFLEALHEGYYKKHFPNMTKKEFEDACFATKPELGACMFEGEAPKKEESK
ncbi:uncharacterized protein JCM6883_007637 [Sporobolomyces salmoneus]|uniref:uncharacterized protein n=1 Tax=Sporobolomyces salmoneus TaxID=183962 RepID=UPI00317DD1E7